MFERSKQTGGESLEDADFEQAEDARANQALQAGLYDQPTPEVSANFDLRIQEALLRRPSRRQTVWTTFRTTLWTACRPAIPAAACTLAGMLVLLQVTQHTPVRMEASASFVEAQAANRQMAYRETNDLPGESPQESIDNLDPAYASLRLFHRPLRRISDKSG